MNENNIMVIFFICLASLGCTGIIVGYWTTVRKSLKGAHEIPSIEDRDSYIQAMREFLDTRLSKDPMYSSNPPPNNLELYEFYRKWMSRFEWKPWRLLAIVIVAQMGICMFTIYHFSEDLAIWIVLSVLLACTVTVTVVCLLFIRLIKRQTVILAVIDRLFAQAIAPDREALLGGSREEREAQAYKLSAIFAAPPLVTDEDIAAHPSCIGEASFIVRGGVAFLVGIGFFMCMVFLGLALIESNAVNESVFPAFLLTGLIGIPVIWFSLLYLWEARRRKRAMATGQGDQAQGPQQMKRDMRYYAPSQLPDMYLPPSPKPRGISKVCVNCGGEYAHDAEICPSCGHKSSRS